MPFMRKIRWDIKEGQEADFRANQEKLCDVMLDHPGVISYHAEYPQPGVSEWTEVYATDSAFKAHLDDEHGKGPLGAIVQDCDKDHLPLLRRAQRGLEEDAGRLRDHVPRDRAARLHAQPAGRQGLAGLGPPSSGAGLVSGSTRAAVTAARGRPSSPTSAIARCFLPHSGPSVPMAAITPVSPVV